MSFISISRSAFVGWMLVVVIVIGVAMLSSGVAAGAEDAVPSPQPGAAGQQAEEGGSDPEANLPFLFAVYLITWAGFFGYTFVMSRRQREMRRELEALKTAIAEKDGEQEK